MKNLDLEVCGVEELDTRQMEQINGGSSDFWTWLRIVSELITDSRTGMGLGEEATFTAGR
ncbi:hypothetical protein [Dysgonomonas termitidis]|uniref:Bacteriocin n=1 Tax=Dysgonomonas termitidis TaxID=1516126 RepID=A0ABV9KWY1_9BACT